MRSLERGGNVGLNALDAGLTRIWVGIGWEPEKIGGRDVDASAFLLKPDGKVRSDEDFIFYNQPKSPEGSVEVTPGSSPDRQKFLIDTSRIPANVEKVAFVATIHDARGISFSQASGVHIRVMDAASGQELVRFTPNPAESPEAALILGELYQRNNEWKFRAVGQGFAGGLGPMARNYGVDIEEEVAPPVATPATPATPAPAPPRPPVPPPISPPIPSQGPPLPLSQQKSSGPPPPVPGSFQPNHQRTSGGVTMRSGVLYPGSNAMLEVHLEAGEQVKAESGAMVAMSNTIDVEGKMEGGLLAGLGRMLAGEKFFFQTLAAKRGPGHVLLAPSLPGDVILLELDGSVQWNVQKNGFLAAAQSVQIDTQMQNLARGLFSGEGFFILKVSGRGLLALNSFGAIHEVNLAVGQEYIIDNAHLVAWPSTTDYKVEKASSGWFSSFTSGEGLVCRFTGPGKVYIQTRNMSSFAQWIISLIPSR